MGVKGEEIVREKMENEDESVDIEEKIGLGNEDVVVEVKEVWREVKKMEDIEDVEEDFRKRNGRRMRIEKKYWRMKKKLFQKKKGIKV